MTRIADFVQHQRLTGNVLDGLTRIREIEAQVSSGKKSQDFAGIANDANRLLVTEIQFGRVRQYIENNNRARQRLEVMDQAVGAMVDVASDLRVLLVQATSDNAGDNVPVAERAQDLLEIIVRELNAKLDGRFLFAGSRTQAPPIASPVPDPAIVGVPDATYYGGDGIELAVRADDEVTLSYGVTGDRLGFQQLVGALKSAIAGDTNDIPGLLETAIDLASASITELTTYRAEIGSKLKTLATTNARHEDFTLYVEGVISDIENVDVALAITELAQQQTIIEASFLTLSRIAGLSLTNFLR
ncbi:MAG: flagellin [Alphaproteobacteria bacterium]